MRRVIREALSYASHYKGTLFVVKLGEKIAPEAEELGLIEDIRLMRNIGVQVIVVLRWNPEDLGVWTALPDVDLHDSRDHTGIADSLARGMMPVVYYREQSKGSINQSAAALAVALGARKLVYVTHLDGVHVHEHRLVHQMTVEDARALLKSRDKNKRHMVNGPMRDKVQFGIEACEAGVSRIHIISGRNPDALIAEIFSSEGVGTLIFSEEYHHIRPARLADCHAIRDVLGDANILPIPSHLQLATTYDRFKVLVADGDHVQGCMCLSEFPQASALEVSQFALVQWADSPEARTTLLEHMCTVARERGIATVFLRPSQNEAMLPLQQWFRQFGFAEQLLGKLAIGTDIKYSAREKVWLLRDENE